MPNAYVFFAVMALPSDLGVRLGQTSCLQSGSFQSRHSFHSETSQRRIAGMFRLGV